MGLEFFMIAALGVLIYFMFRNSRKQRQAQMELQEKLVPGADVMTSFGLYATVVEIDDENNVAVLDTGGGQKIRVHRQVLTKVVEEDAPVEQAPADAEGDAGEDRKN